MIKASIIRPESYALYFSVINVTNKNGKQMFCVDYGAFKATMKADR